MYIISKNHDYYDSALAGGVDKTIVYERKEVDRILPLVDKLGRSSPLSYFNPITIGFCGKVYHGLQVDPTVETRWRTPKMIAESRKKVKSLEKHEGRVFWDMESLLSEDFFKKQYEKKLDTEERVRRYLRPWSGKSMTLRQELEHFFNTDDRDKFEDIFTEQKVVVFRATNWTRDDPFNAVGSKDFVLQINPILKDFEFYKVFDPYTAMQEIMMYIGGVLGSPNRPMIEISDKDILEGKGFDNKISFRQGPTKAAKHEKRKKS